MSDTNRPVQPFIQLIDYHTDRPEEVDALLSEWIRTTEGLRTATRTRVCRDHNDPRHYIEILELPSQEAAMTNSALPPTNVVHEKFVQLCSGEPRFTDLAVLRDQTL